MKLSDIFAAVGDQNVTMQYLHQCLISAKTKGKRGKEHTEITFGTKCTTIGQLGIFSSPGIEAKGPPTRLAVIIWVDEDRWNNAVESIKADEDSKADYHG